VSYDPGDPLLADGYVFRMIAQHEAQHTETILQTISLIDDLRYEPGLRREPRSALLGIDAEYAVVPPGPFLMGTDDRSVAYDNERPAHEVDLPRYRIDLTPVTNAQYLAFMRDGGYGRRDLWTPEGWRWLREARVTHPLHWLAQPGRLVRRGAFRPRRSAHPGSAGDPRLVVRGDGVRALGGETPSHRGRVGEGGRVGPRDARRAPLPVGRRAAERGARQPRPATFAPAAVGAYPAGRSFFGCHQMLGDVWEWTASDFAPYPGFEAFPYREYSEVHFGRGYKVLRGGSWATQPVAIRNTFRNWDLPQRRQIFAGFRCAADV
jgi:iron(II)-dependent oxidoreductase